MVHPVGLRGLEHVCFQKNHKQVLASSFIACFHPKTAYTFWKHALTVASIVFGLSACSSFGKKEASEAKTAAASTQEERSLTEKIFFSTTKLPPKKEAIEREYNCPSLALWDEKSAYRQGSSSAARGIVYQASLLDYARECKAEAGMMQIKAGVQGRLILGDSGHAGNYTIPIHFIAKKDGKTVYSRVMPVAINVAAAEMQANFTVIDEAIKLPITDEDPADVYSLYVGIDGNKFAPTARKRRR